MNNIILKYKSRIFDDKIFFNPDIPPKKLNNALNTYANLEKNEIPLVLIDDTVFGSAKAGLLLTNKTLYVKDGTSNPFSCPIEDINSISFKNYLVMDKLIINKMLEIDFTQPSKKGLKLFTAMLTEICGLENKEKETSWANIGIGVGLGALIGGPIGAAIGGAIGASLDKSNSTKKEVIEENSEITFIVTLSSMMAKIAKADGIITQSEANQISEIFDELGFNGENREIAIKTFKNAKEDNFSIYDYAKQYKEISDYELREFLYASLWLIAIADGKIQESEKEILKRLPIYLGLSKNKFDEIWNGINKERKRSTNNSHFTLSESYTILGCNENSSIQEIKKAYRILISTYPKLISNSFLFP